MQTSAHRRRQRSSIAAISVAVGTVIASNAARAQSVEARTLFNDGIQLIAEGKLAQACEAFAASNRLEPGAGTLLRLGECREQNHQLASAWSAYSDALARAKDQYKREVAKTRVAALEPRLSYLTIAVPEESRIEGLTVTRNGQTVDAMLWNRAVPTDGGEYVIACRATGREDWQVTVRVAVERARASVDVPRLPSAGRLASPTLGPSETPIASPPATESNDDAPPTRELFTTRRKISLGIAGSSAIGAITGTVLGLSARARQSDAFRLCPDPTVPCPQAGQANALLGSGRHRALGANIAFSLAAAAAIGAGVLWFTGAPTVESATRVRLGAVVTDQPSIVVVGRF